MTKKELEEQLMKMPELEEGTKYTQVPTNDGNNHPGIILDTMKEKEQEEKIDYLIAIQSELKAPKNQFNSFGKYKYRSAEDILEAVKPLLKKYGCYLTITETTQEIAGYLVLNSKVSISDGETNMSVEAQAGINPERKGMDIAQSFGSSSSYAKKYALGNLFLLDDTKDADSNKVNEPIAKANPVMTTDIYNAMLEAINIGKGNIVYEKMNNYKMTTKQSEKLSEMITNTRIKLQQK